MQGQSAWPCNMIVRMMNRGNWKKKHDKEMTSSPFDFPILPVVAILPGQGRRLRPSFLRLEFDVEDVVQRYPSPLVQDDVACRHVDVFHLPLH